MLLYGVILIQQGWGWTRVLFSDENTKRSTILLVQKKPKQ
jgi:hypothetical protein